MQRHAVRLAFNKMNFQKDATGYVPPEFVVFDSSWIGEMRSGKYTSPVRLFPSSTTSFEELEDFAKTVVVNFEKKFDKMIYDAAPDLSGGHNRYARGRHKLNDADAVIPTLIPSNIFFWERDLFCIEFTPYKLLAHLGFDLRIFPTKNWFLQVTSWDRDHPVEKAKKKTVAKCFPVKGPDPS